MGRWRSNFSYYTEGARSTAEEYLTTGTFYSEQSKIDSFLRMIPQQYLKQFKSHGISIKKWVNVNSIKSNLDMICTGRIKSLKRRDLFYSRRQKPGESCEEYLQALVKLTENCNFEEPEKYCLYHEQLMHGLSNVKVRQAFASCGTEYKSRGENKQLLEEAMVCAKRVEKQERLKQAKRNRTIPSVQEESTADLDCGDGESPPKCQIGDFSVYDHNCRKAKTNLIF